MGADGASPLLPVPPERVVGPGRPPRRNQLIAKKAAAGGEDGQSGDEVRVWMCVCVCYRAASRDGITRSQSTSGGNRDLRHTMRRGVEVVGEARREGERDRQRPRQRASESGADQRFCFWSPGDGRSFVCRSASAAGNVLGPLLAVGGGEKERGKGASRARGPLRKTTKRGG